MAVESLPPETLTTSSRPQLYDIICYWDGFGIGEDADQKRLLERIQNWLKPKGSILIDIYTPWYAVSTVGKGWKVGKAQREYGFDPQGSRWLDTWTPIDTDSDPVTQSLRCYSPADLQLLLAGIPLEIVKIKSGPGPLKDGSWSNHAPLLNSLSYTAQLKSRF